MRRDSMPDKALSQEITTAKEQCLNLSRKVPHVHAVHNGLRVADETAIQETARIAYEALTKAEAYLVRVAPAEPKKLLRLMTTVNVAAVEKFVTKEYFKVDTSEKAKVKIALLLADFSTHFLPKVEEGSLPGELRVHRLLAWSLDAPIMAELGDPRFFSTTLADLWVMLEKQPSGEEGVLLTNGWTNNFYIHDQNETLWGVNAFWYAGRGGWLIGAQSVGSLVGWYEGIQVLTC
jgi:hypothetical protein